MAVSGLTRDAAAEEKRIDREEYECVDESDHGDAEVEEAPLHGCIIERSPSYQSNKAEGNEKNDGKDATKQHVPGDPSLDNGITWIRRIEVTDRSRAGRKAADYRFFPSKPARRARRKVVSARAICLSGDFVRICDEDAINP